ncbi:cytochrome P450 [Nocardia seriolae]|uniref:Pentalenic acid synthase n=1 Tax=Nocardia seriolae TaxID=37332 RepID=A0A0B8NDN6_9NOCA|nr:cytochrome P450 [Nocardia seriolae]APA98741.1 Pentalenic acid synthase [Nocardia seriolae]MTJ63815.1 cytochrome P450 [Nocardia seriolae]MTJ72276.1 cytochrome P450 [Nocardia seriolae]MTJ88375.1 cytochrome P450 [Nocardia seriolae]MTK32360.1 cytochrome P450 [Nocardia seriolae]
MSESPAEPTFYPGRRSATCPFRPAAEIAELAAAGPISTVRTWEGKRPWLITGYHEARELFADARVSADNHHPSYPHIHEGMKAIAEMSPRTMFNTDGAEHARYRRMLAKPFTPKRLEAMRPNIQKHIDETIDAMLAAGDSADLVTALSLPVPSLMICELLGVPYEDHAFFQEATELGFGGQATAEEQQQSTLDVLGFLNKLVEAKTADPAEDLLSDIAELVNSGELQVWEAALQAVGILVAGHETTANMISLAVIALLDQPEQLALIRDTDDPAVLANAVDELIRYMTIVDTGLRRVAAEDIEVAGTTIHAGDPIVFDLASANFDAKVFTDPETLDLTRENAGAHLSFGSGRHQCIGLQLARIELGMVLQTLFRRIPELRLGKPVEEIEFKWDAMVYGVVSLPVEW